MPGRDKAGLRRWQEPFRALGVDNDGHARRRMGMGMLFRLLGMVLALLVAAPAARAPALAQPPLIIDPQDRIARPDLGALRLLRITTDDDYPPFHYIAADGQLAGFNVDLARAVCLELKVACTIQTRRWDRLLPSLDERQADMVLASHRITPALRATHDVSRPYLRLPARFVARHGEPETAITPAGLLGQPVGVMERTQHEAWLAAHFPRAALVRFSDPELARGALKRGEVKLLFGDAIALAIWLHAEGENGCCRFIGGAYHDSLAFSEGAGAVFRKDQPLLRRAFDHALQRLIENGTYNEIYLKHFPVSFH
jgi:polar amino acid transport system substrate-binding protein